MSVLFPHYMDLRQGRMYFLFVFSLFFRINFAYDQSLTPWFCTKPNPLDSSVESSQTLASCLPGYAINIEDVVYESTVDGECSGKSLCSLHNKNTLTFACNQKRTCSLKIRHLRFHINSTCDSTIRFYIKYRCLPVIQEQKHYLCSSLTRRDSTTDIQLSCENSYRLFIKMALVGINTRQYPSNRNIPLVCDKNTYWLCNYYVPDAYRNVCNNRLNYGSGSHCEIRYNDRPRLKGCPHGEYSNFSLIEYLCIPGEGIIDDLPRIDICANDDIEYLSINRGLLHSPHYPHSLGTYLSCKKRLQISHESRLQLFMLEKSIEYSHQLNIRLLTTEPNIQRTLVKNEYFETNLTKETIEIELKTNHVGEGKFLLYFQVDSRISENAPMILESDRTGEEFHRRRKTSVKRDWGIVIGCLIGLLLVVLLIVIVLVVVRISKHRRDRTLRYMRPNDDDHHQHLNEHHQSKRGIQIEHPHLLSTSTVLGPTHNQSDRESLLQQSIHSTNPSTTNENFYEEITDSRQRDHLDSETNTYLQPKSFENKQSNSQPISDHRENEARFRRPAPLATPEKTKHRLESILCDAPMASTETLDVGTGSEQLKHSKQVPPPRSDLPHPKPSAPPLHLLQQDLYSKHNQNI